MKRHHLIACLSVVTLTLHAANPTQAGLMHNADSPDTSALRGDLFD
jgi:hypothetical protein